MIFIPLCLLLSINCWAQGYKCLPADVRPTEFVSERAPANVNHGTIVGDTSGGMSRTTVEQYLWKIGAKCRKGKLVTRKRKAVRFYRLLGCWGNPPANYKDILEKQDMELATLRKRFYVVEIACDQSGMPVY